MSDQSKQPLFIVGAPRSGTSLLRNLIRECDDIYLPPDETQFLPAYLDLVSEGCSTRSLVSFLDNTPFSSHMRSRGMWPTRDELTRIVKEPAPAVAIPALMQHLANREGSAFFAFWGDKTPRYIYFLESFRSVFPNMRVLFIVRDPRDAVLSMRDAWGRSLVRGATEWRNAAHITQAYREKHGPTLAHIINYESLATDPVGVMVGIADWLGIRFSIESLQNYTGEEKWGAVRNDEVVNTSVGRYRIGLSRADTEFVESLVIEEMRSCGYVPDFAEKAYTPTKTQLGVAHVADRFRSVATYVSERGLRQGLRYKIWQFLVARRKRNR